MKMRVIETNVGIQNEVTVEMFDSFARTMRDRGWNGVNSMIASGLRGGDMLEIGPGPGYVGLEIAKKLTPDSLTGCEISPAMLQFARKNAKNYLAAGSISAPEGATYESPSAAGILKNHIPNQGKVFTNFPLGIDKLHCLQDLEGFLMFSDCYDVCPAPPVIHSTANRDIRSYIKCFFQ